MGYYTDYSIGPTGSDDVLHQEDIEHVSLAENQGMQLLLAMNGTEAGSLPGGSGGGPSKESESGEGAYVREGLSPILLKVAKRIQRGEFIEMEELLLELWLPPNRMGRRQRHL